MSNEPAVKHLCSETLDSLRELQSEDDPNFFVNFLNIVKETANAKLGLIGRAIETGNATLLAAESHALKSSCLNAGFERMGALSLVLEGLGKQGKLEGADSVFRQLVAEHAAVLLELNALPEFRAFHGGQKP